MHSILNLIFQGPDSIDKRDSIFGKANNKLMSKTELAAISKVHKADELRTMINYTESTEMDNFKAILPKCETFCRAVIKYSEENQSPINIDLILECKKFISNKNNQRMEVFISIMNYYYHSVIVNHGSGFKYSWVEFVLLKQERSSGVLFKQENSLVILTTKNELEIPSNSSVHIALKFLVHCKSFVKLIIALPNYIIAH